MMQALELLWLAKGMSRDEATLNSEEIKAVAIAITELRLCINFVEEFMVDLKAFLGLAMPNQSCLDVTK